MVYKKDFADRLADNLQITKHDAEVFTDGFLTTITQFLSEGEDVNFIGFGKFGTRERQAKNGYNPYDKTYIQIPKSIKPYFTAGKTLKDSL